MQSSAIVTLRALVMLVCLVLVPLAAVFGFGLPQAFEAVLDGHSLPRMTDAKSHADDARSRGGDAPVFGAPSELGSSPNEAPASRSILDATGSLWAPGAPAHDRVAACWPAEPWPPRRVNMADRPSVRPCIPRLRGALALGGAGRDGLRIVSAD